MTLNSDAFIHGPGSCRACHSDRSRQWHALEEERFGSKGKSPRAWSIRANPGYWGSQEPEVLVLGFSKGGDQNEMIDLHLRGRRPYEDIPFNSTKGSMRQALVQMLETMGLCPIGQSVDALFVPGNGRFGFASVIRCSVSMYPDGGNDRVQSGQGILERTIDPATALPFVSECIVRHLLPLPQSVRLVVMLSSSEKYVEACRRRFGGIWINPAATRGFTYLVGRIPFVHVPHVSGQAQGFRKVFNGERPPSDVKERDIPLCLEQAREAVWKSGLAALAPE